LLVGRLVCAFVCGALLLGLAVVAESAEPDCVTWRCEARPDGLGGFDHLVHLRNGCEHAVRCEISTDVNPELAIVGLLPGSEKTVNTLRSSPARVFRPWVRCQRK
jgi:hypothetical protein